MGFRLGGLGGFKLPTVESFFQSMKIGGPVGGVFGGVATGIKVAAGLGAGLLGGLLLGGGKQEQQAAPQETVIIPTVTQAPAPVIKPLIKPKQTTIAPQKQDITTTTHTNFSNITKVYDSENVSIGGVTQAAETVTTPTQTQAVTPTQTTPTIIPIITSATQDTSAAQSQEQFQSQKTDQSMLIILAVAAIGGYMLLKKKKVL